jgi:hypothetical protein
MKKSKLSIGLVTSFIGALALTSCGDAATVTPSDKSVVDFIGYNSSTDRIEINVDELYREFGEGKDGTTKYYNAILESLIRYEYPKLAADENPKEPDLKKFSRIKSEAADKVKAARQTANDNATNNGTEPEDEWTKILESNDVDSEENLRLKYVYELEKEAMTDWYFKKHFETSEDDTVVGLRQEYIGVSATTDETTGLTKDWTEIEPATENVEPVFPYHVIHILVKLSADAGDYSHATISESEAEKLWDIVRHLVDGQYSFEETAKLSDDTSSSEFGDVELMSTRTSFYNEFKLGTYAYDAILSANNSETADVNDNIYKAFGIDSSAEIVTKTMAEVDPTTGVEYRVETKEKVVDLIKETMLEGVNVHLQDPQTSLPAIPFDVFRQIGLNAKEDKIGTFSPEGSQASLPRNVLFNAFLNFRSPFVITNELLKQDSVSFGDDQVATETYNFDDEEVLKLQSNNFQSGKLGDPAFTKKVLCDTNGNVVIGVRSTAGIHFMVMRKSVFENTNKKAYEKVVYKADGTIDEDASTLKTHTSLEDYYYTAQIPTDKDYDHDHETYVNIKNVNDSSYYTNRVNTIKNDVKSSNFDAAYDYRLYETLLNYPLEGGALKDRIHFSDEVEGKSVIRANIERTISQLRESAKLSQEESINKAWTEYLMQLINQNELRSDDGMYKDAFVPTTCAFSFKKGNEDLWKEGGECYVK